MNNESTHLLQLDQHRIPSNNVQRFVDDLVHTYEKRTLKAKVLHVDGVEHQYTPTLNLDILDSKINEDDVMSARIFPKPDHEKIREEMYKHIDAAVENYANTIITHSKKILAYAPHVYAIASSVSIHGYVYTRTLAEKIFTFIRASFAERVVEIPITVEPVVSMQEQAVHTGMVDHEYALTLERTILPAPRVDTLVYSYGIPTEWEQAPVYGAQEPKVSVINHTPSTPLPDIATKQESVEWNHVAHALYLQFRYGPKNLR